MRPHNQLTTHFDDWKNFELFLKRCRAEGVKKIYITGQNTDSLMYRHLYELITELQRRGFGVGLRTNGYLALNRMSSINLCDLSVGYSIHSLNPATNQMIMGRSDLPDWNAIIPATLRPRVSIVLNRCNEHEFWDLLKFTSQFSNIRYIQVRRPSTDTRAEMLAPDVAAYERVYTVASAIFGPPEKRFVEDAEAYIIHGQEVVFWRTVKTSVNSLNYFTDGTCSDAYFVVEGYLANAGNNPEKDPSWNSP